MTRTAALALLPLLAACASLPADTARADLAAILDGRSAGVPVRCLDRQGIDGPQIVDARTLIYRENRRRLWVNTLPAACPALRRDSYLIVQMYGSQLCENDRFQAAQSTDVVPGPICRLGRFVPWDLPRR